MKNLKKSLLDGSNGGGKDSLDDFDGSSDKDKQSSSPLIIDGMEVDNEVRNKDKLSSSLSSFSFISLHLLPL